MTALSRRSLLQASAAAVLASCRLRRGLELTLGAVAARTGPRAVWGEDLLHGMELAVALQNVRGGINGRRVRLVALDNESQDEQAPALAARMIEREGALALFGELSSIANEKAAQAAQRRNVLFVAPGSAARDVSRVGDFIFRTALTDHEHAMAMARHIRLALQKRRAAIVYRRSSLLHVGMADAFAAGFRGNGGEMALRESYTDDTELVRLVSRVRQSGADVVYAPADSADAGRIAVAMRQGRVTAQLCGGDGWASAEVQRYAGDALAGVLYTDAFFARQGRPEVDVFLAAFRERYRAVPGTFAALGYDAMRWVIGVAQHIPGAQLDTRALRDALLNSHLSDGVANPFRVDARRSLQREINVLRYERGGGVELAGTMSP
ncbi:MAG: ABC transporter substrate-binding protein [Myxococcales bacterium]|nr:ABC transporter substrate-binding protein [Myxococcales bacterium]